MKLDSKMRSNLFFIIYFVILFILACCFCWSYLFSKPKPQPVQVDVVTHTVKNVESVDIKQAEVIFLVDGHVYLHTTVTPDDANDKTLKWYSSDEKIVTVSNNGVIHAVSAGEATVSVVSVNGKTDSCHVIVREEEKTTVESIKLEKSRLCLYEGDSAFLKYELLPKDVASDVTFTSSNPTVISVTPVGEVKALKEGTATITAQTSNGKKATCEVHSYKHVVYQIPVTGLTMNHSSASLLVNDTLQLEVLVTPSNAYDQTITWSSDTPSVAIVNDKGVVTGLKEGRATIVATSSNNIRTSCELYVTAKKQNISVTGLSLDQTSIQMEKGQLTTLKLTVIPENATNKSVVWGTSDSSVVSVSQKGEIKAVGAGVSTVSVFSDNGKSASIKVTVTGSKVSYVLKSEDLFNSLSTKDVQMAQVAVFANGEVQSNYAYQTDANTKFKISSASKSVLGIVAAKMDAEGIVNLDTNVDTYWRKLYNLNFTTCSADWRSYVGSEKTVKKYTASTVKLVENPATLRNCLTHSSTIKNMNMVYMEPGNTSSEYFGGGMSKTYGRAAFMLSHTSHQLFEQGGIPGSTTSYQTLKDSTTRDHALAGFTMQIAMKESINEYMTREILTPLGCTSSPQFTSGNSIYFATSYQTSAVDLAKIIGTIANDGMYQGKQIFSQKAIQNIEKVESKLNNQTIAFDYTNQKYVKYGSFSSISDPTPYKLGDVVNNYVSYISYDPKTSAGFVITIQYKSKPDKTQVYNMLQSASNSFYANAS